MWNTWPFSESTSSVTAYTTSYGAILPPPVGVTPRSKSSRSCCTIMERGLPMKEGLGSHASTPPLRLQPPSGGWGTDSGPSSRTSSEVKYRGANKSLDANGCEPMESARRMLIIRRWARMGTRMSPILMCSCRVSQMSDQGVLTHCTACAHPR